MILELKNISIEFQTQNGLFPAIQNASIFLNQSEILAIVGESGSGKSVLTQSIVKLIPSPPSNISEGEINFAGKNLVELTESQLRKIRGRRISIIFQDAMTALNPTMKIGEQITESLMTHFFHNKKQRAEIIKELLEHAKSQSETHLNNSSGFIANEENKTIELKTLGLKTVELKKIVEKWLNQYFHLPEENLESHIQTILAYITSKTARDNLNQWIVSEGNMNKARATQIAIDLLTQVKIPEAKQRLNQYIFQFSGGMRQRIMIAVALACKPEIIIADEPTTALDVTIKSEVLDLLAELKHKFNISILLITHDLGIVAAYADRIGVLYAGDFVEIGTCDDIFYHAKHPYTRGLLNAIPRLDHIAAQKLMTIPGNPPNLFQEHKGCRFVERCEYAMQICANKPAGMFSITDEHKYACHLSDTRAATQREKFDRDYQDNSDYLPDLNNKFSSPEVSNNV